MYNWLIRYIKGFNWKRPMKHPLPKATQNCETTEILENVKSEKFVRAFYF